MVDSRRQISNRLPKGSTHHAGRCLVADGSAHDIWKNSYSENTNLAVYMAAHWGAPSKPAEAGRAGK